MGIRRNLLFVAAVAGSLSAALRADAAISYTTMGSLYSENFDGLPTNMAGNNASIQANALYSDGWQDDVDFATSPQNDVSVLGWHLYHPLTPSGGEDGVNNHQRLRNGQGANTGAFWLFGPSASDPDKSLGSVGATTVAANGESMFYGLQLINNTGQTLNRFTLTYNGEQWRDGQSPSAETLLFDYSLSASDLLWTTQNPTPLFTAAPQLDFTSPVFGGTTTTGDAVDGNGAGRLNDVTATITGFSWEPGAELWLRWGDPQLASSSDDGLSIDDVRFTADNGGVGNPNDVFSVMTGLASTPSTWSNNQAPSFDKSYRVVNGHTVSIDAPFAGNTLRVQSGGVLNINDAGNGADLRLLIVDEGALLTETVSGSFQLGDAFADAALGVLSLSQDLVFNLDAGSDARVDMAVTGAADLTFVGNGAGSDVILFDVANLDGIVNFNGNGDRVRLVRDQRVDRMIMNSTGANVLSFEHSGNTGSGVIIFNQAGTIDHASTSASSNRLVQRSVLEANATVTLDLTKTFTPDGVSVFGERRFSVSDSLRGAGNVIVNGTAGDSTNVAGFISLNEFELGFTSDSSGAIPANTYTGTLTANNYVNVELRNSLAGAKLVVNDNARLEMGRQVVGTDKATNFGEIEVNAGGTLEIGFEQVDTAAATGNHVAHLRLVNTSNRAGSLKLTNGGLSSGDPNSEPVGSMVVMQVNGKDANQFDTIAADGTINLDGVLKILVNPQSSLGTTNPNPIDNPIYTPTLGDEMTLITSNAGAAPSADFSANGTVDAADLTIWKSAFGATALGDADGDLDTDGNDFLLWQRQLGQSGGGGIAGTFDSVVYVDSNGTSLANSSGVIAGGALKFQIQYGSSAVKLLVVANSALAAVPEPSTIMLATLASLGFASRARGRRRKDGAA